MQICIHILSNVIFVIEKLRQPLYESLAEKCNFLEKAFWVGLRIVVQRYLRPRLHATALLNNQNWMFSYRDWNFRARKHSSPPQVVIGKRKFQLIVRESISGKLSGDPTIVLFAKQFKVKAHTPSELVTLIFNWDPPGFNFAFTQQAHSEQKVTQLKLMIGINARETVRTRRD